MSKRCEKELFVEKYFELVPVITNEETKVITDFGQLVNLLAMFEAQLKEVKETKYIPTQKCPKCDGQGIVSKPPWISGDQQTWESTSLNHQCDVCNGQKIIPMVEIKSQ